ncbi:MAG: hypothetical protein U1F65_04455 [Verrucomicrobiota bacterium]
MTLNWNPSPSANIVGYNVYYGVNSLSYTNMLSAGSSTSMEIAGLVEGKTYYFAASAVDIAGLESDLSEEVAYWVATTNSTENLPPTISIIPNQIIPKNSSLAPVEFVIGDPDTAAEALTVSAFSSYPLLVPVGNISFGGAGSNRTVQITPSVNLSGIASIGIIVTDDHGNSSVRQFNLTVLSSAGTDGSTPTIASLRDAVITQNSSGTNLPFVLTDSDTPLAQVSVIAVSDDAVLFPSSSLSVTGTGTNRVLRVTPAINRSGTAHIAVFATDEAGHTGSFTNTVVVLPSEVTSTIQLFTSGNGTVTPNLSVRTLTVGKKYSITAKPTADSLFVGWSGDIVSTAATLNFTYTPDMTLTANFIPNPFIPASGSYSALFAANTGVQPDTAGGLSTSITSKGSYSGKVRLAGKDYSFSGKMNLQCQATNRIKRGTNYLTVVMQADQLGQIFGTLKQDGWLAPMQGVRSAYNAKTNPAPQTGSYTMMLHGKPADPVLPSGHSFGYVKVTANGLASFVGSLADGTKVTQSAFLSRDGLWPFYSPLYSGKGVMTSWQLFRNLSTTDFDGWLVWIKPTNSASRYYPNGFEYQRNCFGERYVAPTGTNVVFSAPSLRVPFAFGDLPADFANLIRIEKGNKVVNLSSNKLTMTFSASTGVYQGTVADPVSHKTWPFSGVVLQRDNVGYGFLSGTNESSQMGLFPN